MLRLENKVALITGGASGIGLATAKIFLEEGAKVVIVDRDTSVVELTAADSGSDALMLVTADLTDDASHSAYVQQIQDKFGRLDIAVFNAGIAGVNTPLETYPVEVFDAVMAVNLRAIWLGLRAVIPLMKTGTSGSIILTSSIQGLAAIGGTTAYTTSKHALVGMMKGASLELAPHNIRVNAVHPGYVGTPMMDRIHQEAVPDNPDAFAQTLSASVPMQRYAKAEEIGNLMAFLASDEASYSTGSSFIADGGMLAALP